MVPTAIVLTIKDVCGKWSSIFHVVTEPIRVSSETSYESTTVREEVLFSNHVYALRWCTFYGGEDQTKLKRNHDSRIPPTENTA